MAAELLNYIDAAGVDTSLSTQASYPDRYLYRNSVLGRFAAPAVVISDAIPDADGERYRESYFGPRPVTVPVTILGATKAELRSRLAALQEALSPRKGPGTLHLTRSDGTTRKLTIVS